MGKILDYIATETNGKCFTSFKYCYDDSIAPNIEYGSSDEESYISVEDEDTLNKVFEIFKDKFKDEFNFID